MDLAGQRDVVTGGAGFIGSHVVDALVGLGSDVVAVDDLSVGSRENLGEAEERGAKLVVGDVRDADLLDQALDGAAVVVHMACDNLRASLGNPLRSHEVNATGSLVPAPAGSRGAARRL